MLRYEIKAQGFSLAWIFHELSLLDIQGKDLFAVAGYAKRLMTQKIQQDRLALVVNNFAKFS